MPLNEGLEYLNAPEMHQRFPETFQLPDDKMIAEIEEGVFVKVCAGGERFWINIGTIEGEMYTGLVDNDLVLTHEHGLVAGDEITVHKDNIMAVYAVDADEL